ncbi:hypothetical protein Poli38472_011683 [Pythium oligandrum]|uniref:Dynein axonemal intermediate chain 4 n=1 Tax=Pythium oligandrum TaxID=41045 RepID=A0A8K1FCA0_PYTOL|nr:hypothetical protein Poli38472_011683 [Pythium oligandrum]|eukprot:TMW58095.1 hypothetical protein Poli38472_011683 [Pythium oligandrum]
MSSPSSARINPSTTKITRNTKRDINASRSRAFGASAVSNSSRQVAGTGGGAGRSSARVYLDGVDVTPQSLLVSRIKPSSSHDQRSHNKGTKGKTRSSKLGGGNSVMGASVILSQDHLSSSSIDDSSDGDPASSANIHTQPSKGSNQRESARPPAKATPSSNAPQQPSSGATPTSLATSVAATGPEDEEDGNGALSNAATVTSKPLSDVAAPGSSRVVTEVTLKTERKARRLVTIELTETSTEMLFELKSVCVAQDATYHQAITARNKQYLEMCAGKKGSDKFVEGRSQTLQLAQKSKEVMTAPPATRDSACTATDWDIFDCTRIDDENANDHEDNNAIDASSVAQGKPKAPGEAENGEVVLKQQVHEIVDATMASPGCVLDVDGDIVADLRARQHALRHARKQKHGVGNSTTLSNSQKSRIFHSNTNQSAQDIGRSTANALGGGNSGASMTSPSQSSANVSFGASQDVINTLGGGEDSSNSAQNSQIGLNSTSQVMSGGNESADAKQSAYARANTNVDLGETIAHQRTSKVLASSSLLKVVSVVERAVQQNVYHHQHVLYRNFPALTPASSATESSRKDKHHAADRDWRSTIGLLSPPVAASAPVVPPIANLGSSGLGLTGRHEATSRHELEKLWTFECELTRGRTVSCLVWNTVNKDLLAVSYTCAAERPECPSLAAIGVSNTGAAPSSPIAGNGPSSFPGGSGAPLGNGGVVATTETDGGDGLILFWSLKNPEFPERIYNLNVGVTSIDFSHTHPYLLAVGFADGVVAIYDTRKDDFQSNNQDPTKSTPPTTSGPPSRPPSASSDPTSKPRRLHVPVPIATSETSTGKHLDAVWQVKWISKGSDRGENVVSISSDGRVTEWSMKKGLSFSDLMTLKRVSNPLLGSDSRADGVISRQASGHCIDFAKHDPSVYYVGTEDGVIHKCSVSYNEQYLQTYYGHTGPVYQLLVSPFSPDLFLSCSADWNVKLWHQVEQKEMMNFRSVNLQHAVTGITWCPSDATIFGAVTEDGRIEIWDLEHSSLDPIITHFPKKYAPVSVPTATPPATTKALGAQDLLDEFAGIPASPGAGSTLEAQPQAPREIPLECSNIAFAPTAPVIVVGDSTGDVTVYRVQVLADGRDNNPEHTSVEDQIARLHRALNPNKHD